MARVFNASLPTDPFNDFTNDSLAKTTYIGDINSREQQCVLISRPESKGDAELSAVGGAQARAAELGVPTPVEPHHGGLSAATHTVPSGKKEVGEQVDEMIRGRG